MRQKAGRMSITLGTLDPLRTWLAEEATRRRTTPTAVAKDALQLARECLEALDGMRSRLEALALLEGKSRGELLAQIIQRGVTAALEAKGAKR